MIVEDLNTRDDLFLVTNSQDVRELRAFMSLSENREAKDFDGFFVKIEEGEYTEIYGFSGNVPYLWKFVYRIR